MSALTTAEITLLDLDGLKCHVAWREEPDPKDPDRMLKVPYSPRTGRKASGPHSTWGGTRKAAKGHAKSLLTGKAVGGLGIVLGTPYRDYRLLGIDLDGCRDPEFGTIAQWARKIIKGLPATYTEVSPSGTGVKLFMFCTESDWQRILDRMGKKPDGEPRQGRNFKVKAPKGEKAPGIEAYIGERYFTVTEELLPGSPETLAIVTAEDFLWVIKTAGPQFLADHGGKADAGHDGGWNDESESGIGWRIAVEAARDGVTFEEYCDRLKDCDDVSRWREDDRQVERAWENALAKAEKEAERIIAMFDDLGPNPDGPGPLEQMNEAHAVVRNGGETLIATFKRDRSINFGSVADLHLFYKNKQLYMNGKTKPVSEHWIEWTKRRQYENGVVFDPSGKVDGKTLNLWGGWAVRPNADASCKLFLKHLRHVVCNGDEVAFRYIVAWMADLVQNAGRKPGVGLVLKGSKGAGKSIVSDYLAKMIGPRHCPPIAATDHLTGKFNAHMEAALLLCVEEGYWAGNRAAEGVLKNLVTNERITIERKGVDPMTLQSSMRIIITSNSDWIVPATFDERRWAVFNVSDSRINDEEYFAEYSAEMEGDGPAALLHYLQTYDLAGFNVRKAPETEGLLEQKLASLRDFDLFWFDALHRGHLQGDSEWETLIGRPGLVDDYNQQAKDNKHHMEPMNERAIGKRLRKLCPEKTDTRGPRPKRTRYYKVPDLEECRRAFEKLAKRKIDWSGENA